MALPPYSDSQFYWEDWRNWEVCDFTLSSKLITDY